MTDRKLHHSATEARGRWWSRPGGGREVLAVAAPLVVSSLSWTVMTFVDRMMLFHWSGAAMAAAFVASTAWFAVVCFPLGVCAYANTFVAQYHGAGRPHRIGPAVWQGVWIALAATPFFLAIAPCAAPVFRAAGHTPDAVALESRYFAILCLGAPAMLLSQALGAFYSGRGKTVVVMVVDATFALLNLALDWWWIFGLTVEWAGGSFELFPAAGIAGAGWATVVSLWLKAGVYFWLLLRRANRRAFSTGAFGLDRPLLARMAWFGGPSGLQMLLDILGFTVFVLLIARLGDVAMEASTMTFSVGSLAFMPVCGVGMAVSILVGQHLGENREEAAAQATWTSLHVSWAYMAVVSAAMIFAPGWLMAGFLWGESPAGTDPAHRVAVASLAAVLLRFNAAYNFLDAVLLTFVSALKGAGDTRYILWVSLAMGALLGLLTWAAIEQFNFGVYGCWAIVSAWIFGLAILFYLRFRAGHWRSMRVIEPAPPTPATGATEV